jgi:Mg2+-importing ATPase
MVTGPEIDARDAAALAHRVCDTGVFAEVEPLHKERIVAALQAAGEVVGFLGDGINDAAALHAADVGISVDTAVDVAKQAAGIVLLDKNLAVVADGVRLGRQTSANTLKYIRVTTSANFGNMLSMAVAAVVLPFLPLLPRQILLLNFLTDLPGTTITADRVDPEQLDRPRAWNMASERCRQRAGQTRRGARTMTRTRDKTTNNGDPLGHSQRTDQTDCNAGTDQYPPLVLGQTSPERALDLLGSK